MSNPAPINSETPVSRIKAAEDNQPMDSAVSFTPPEEVDAPPAGSEAEE